MIRRPTATRHSAAIPTLGALLAAGAELVGCHDPLCGGSRADELSTHGHEAAEQLRSGHVAESVRAIGIATGLKIHPPLPAVVRPPPDVDGGIGAVDPTPPPTPQVPPLDRIGVSGGMRGTTPVSPPRPPSPPARPTHGTRRAPQPPPPAPHYAPHWQGDVGAVMAVPADATRRLG